MMITENVLDYIIMSGFGYFRYNN